MRIRIILFLLAFSFNNVLTAQYFTEVSRFAGIDHAFNVDLATFGGGAAIIDYDNDGFEDVYLTGGNNADALYKNNGDGTFTNVIEGAGFENTILIHTQGATAADVNRDGYKDLLVTTMYYKADRELSPNLLFLNNGDGTFKDVTRQYGLDNYKSN
ncbi:MAG: VCBS repeat-containing protein, partial [Saprospiraceae bacterium]|nr:VCBS repeat-containing protein [Saprospiraceae bacterium]